MHYVTYEIGFKGLEEGRNFTVEIEPGDIALFKAEHESIMLKLEESITKDCHSVIVINHVSGKISFSTSRVNYINVVNLEDIENQ